LFIVLEFKKKKNSFLSKFLMKQTSQINVLDEMD